MVSASAPRSRRWLPPGGVPALLTWIAAGLAAAAGLLHIGLLCYVFAKRATYPLDLEWMEGGMLCHALRFMEGQPLYAPPSADFISYLYTPLYPLLLSGLGKVVGLGYTLGRLVSVVSFLGTLGLLVRAAWREGGRQGALWGLAAAGLCAASFQYTGAWYDLVRNDSLYLLLITAALYLLRYHHARWPWLIFAGVLAGLAFLTKQTASLFIIYSGLAMLVLNWRRLPVHVAVVGLVAGGSVLLWNHLSDGWFWRYTFEMHQGHDLYWERLWPQTELRLLSFFPAVAAVIALWMVVTIPGWAWRRRLPPPDRALLYWLGIAVVGVAVSAVGFATQWAAENAYIPGLVFPSALAGMVGANLAQRWQRGRLRWLSAGLSLCVAGALIGQLVSSRYAPAQHIPSERDRTTGQALVDRLRDIDGPVLMPYHPYYPVLVGKRPGYPQMGINDVTRAGYPFPPDIRKRVSGRHYAAIVLDNPPGHRYHFIFAHYKLDHQFRVGQVPEVVTGYRVRPTYIFTPKRVDPVPADGRRVFGFEQGTYAGWQIEGDAFGHAPVGGPAWSQGPVGPFEGSFLVNSGVGGDRRQGTLRSPEFEVDRPVLTYRVGGGNDLDTLMVRLLVDDQPVHVDTGPGSNVMVRRRVDVAHLTGKRMRVELVDAATGSWGHLLFDDLMLLAR